MMPILAFTDSKLAKSAELELDQTVYDHLEFLEHKIQQN